jgi:hypothetical protein
MQKKQPAGCFFVACDLLVGALNAAIRLARESIDQAAR